MFYRPEKSVAADVIPFHKDGEFYLFYLRDYRNFPEHGEGTPWFLLKTKDFVHYEEKGEVIARGTKEEQDLYIFTGCVFEHEQKGFIYYTGHNPHFIAQGKPQECIMLAKSDDFHNWEKADDFKIFAPDCFEPHDFRDPFVFFNQETNEYNMLLAARVKYGPNQRRGCTAVATSENLLDWQVQETPFYFPENYYTHECPDLFRMGDWWYLVFSEFNDRVCTRYRMSKSLSGPWITPPNDHFDNHAFYAAKTVSDGNKRYIVGWNPTQQEDKDYNHWMWGGNIVVHEVWQNLDGTLAVRAPQSVLNNYAKPIQTKPQQIVGKFAAKDNSAFEIGHLEGHSIGNLGKLENQCRISFELLIDDNVRDFSVFLRADDEFENAYYIKLEPDMQRLTFDRWPRQQACVYHMTELERKIEIPRNQKIHLDILVDGQVVTVYYNGQVAMGARMNDYHNGLFGFTCSYGQAQINGFEYLLEG